jgi:hypothetical protein
MPIRPFPEKSRYHSQEFIGAPITSPAIIISKPHQEVSSRGTERSLSDSERCLNDLPGWSLNGWRRAT